VLARMIQAAVTEGCWESWSRIAAPTLIALGGAGTQLPSKELSRMLTEQPEARYAEVAGAGHELHLEEPALWRAAVTAFLEEVERPPG
jgi:pimeloyl-ACP methyl ester carboxylesterase